MGEGLPTAVRTKLWWGDVVLALGVLALVLFPVASRLAADAQPIAPVGGVQLAPLRARASAHQVHGLPVFVAASSSQVGSLVAGGHAAERAAIDGRLSDLFGARRVRQIERGLTRVTFLDPRLPPLPPASPAQENDLAALLMINAANRATGVGEERKNPPPFANGGVLALDLLRHAVSGGGGCAPQLNLAFLWAADSTQINDPAEHMYEEAVTACPSDPTPLWGLGEYQLQVDASLGGTAGDSALFGTFSRLQREFPGVAASWAGEGDADMLAGYQVQDSEPFMARHYFDQARALYQRALQLQSNFQNRAGLARALAELGDVGAAIATQRRAVAGDAASAELQARLLDYLQRGHRFTQAAAVAVGLAAVHTFPSGAELYASPFPASPSDPNTAAQRDASGDEDVTDPLSTGVGLMEPANIDVIDEPGTSPSASVANLSFLPVFVPMDGIGGSARWCPGWSRLVDLLLSGHPAQVLSDFSRRLVDLRRGESDCDPVLDNGPQDLAGVAELELGHVQAAEHTAAPTSLSDLEDLRQNLWRYAGMFPHAAQATQQWARAQPGNALAIQREGEIAFLRGSYNQAADYFAIVVNRARLQFGHSSEAEALGLLDQGTSLARAGRRAEALATLAAANQAAAQSGGISSAHTGNPLGAAQLSALTMEQTGDILLDTGHLLQATEDYGVASDAESGISTTSQALAAVRLFPDALDNNEAIADIATGDPATGARLAAAATHIDPGDPIFWWTAAEAQQYLGHRTAAISDYRASLSRDPTEYPVANNLGVLLMQRGEDGAAVAALRRSVGANRDYATGWFNLGVALERWGPLHVAASEGSLARARALDSKFASRGPVPLFDNTTHMSHLDLSKPLPANWTFASTQTHAAVAAAGLSVILVIALGLARSLAARAKPGGAQKWFDVIDALDKKAPNLPFLRNPALGVVATAAFLLWPLHSGPTDGWAATAVFAIGVLILIAVVLRVRVLAATHEHISLRQETFPPAVAFGLMVTLVGAGWSPLPVARAPGKATDIHWAGPTAVGTLAIVLLVLATWLGVPIARSLGAAGLVMSASLLTPVTPIDGATVSSTAVGALPSLVVLGAAVLMLVGLL
jgi:cellulose synthase operon protein C